MQEDVIRFWFEEIEPKCWWVKSDELDKTICSRFGETHAAAVRGELDAWREAPEGRLAEIIVIDQFSRNIYRDRPESFAWDAVALVLSQEAIRCGDDVRVPIERRAFLYLPFMHSESAAIHARAVELFDQPGLESNYEFELKHKAIIDRFGRYPHRNAVLGRTSTAEEEEFLTQPGSSF